MRVASIRVEVPDQGGKEHLIVLSADGQPEAKGVLTRADLEAGKWPAQAILTRLQQDGGPDNTDFQEIGAVLYQWLFPDRPADPPTAETPRQLWQRLQQAEPVLLQMQVASAELDVLPWELIHENHRRQVFLGGVVRLHSGGTKNRESSAWPLRILVLVGCTADEERQLGVREEIDQIRRAFLAIGRSVDVHPVMRPDRKSVLALLDKYHPHVLHFVGHGVHDPPTAQSGLLFSNESQGWIWKEKDLPTELPPLKSVPMMVFLNACRTSGEQGHTWSMKDAFLNEGVPCLLTMQGNVNGRLAGAFAARFYSACAGGKDVSTAVREARQELVNSHGVSYQARDWALPVLTFNEKIAKNDPLRIFLPKEPPADPRFERCKEFNETAFFADFSEFRRELIHWHYPISNPPSQRQPIAVVTGDGSCGKSHLVKWCLESYAFGDCRIRYIPMNCDAGENFLSLLRRIRDGEPLQASSTHEWELLHGPLEPEPFWRFNWDLNHLLTDGVTRELTDLGPIADQVLPLKPQGERLLDNIFSSFRRALQEAGKRHPLLLVFDHFYGPNGERMVSPEQFELLIRGVFTPMAKGELPNVQVLFVARHSEYLDYRLHTLPQDRVLKIQVKDGYTEAELMGFAHEMCWYQEEETVTKLAQASVTLKSAAKGLARLRMVSLALTQIAPGTVNVWRMR